MAEVRLELTEHRSQRIEAVDLGSFDYVFAMTASIAQRLVAKGVNSDKITTLNVVNPFGRGITVYRATAKALQDHLSNRCQRPDCGFGAAAEGGPPGRERPRCFRPRGSGAKASTPSGLMALGHVLGDGGVAISGAVADVGSDA